MLNKEIGYESDTGRYKIGNGTDKWKNLPYASADKLATPRTLTLSGGATGTSSVFDGSKNASMTVNKLDE